MLIENKSPKIIEFENWINSFLNFEKLPQKNMFWLDTMNFVCDKLNHPQKSFKCIHIAGSKGKGSVSKMISSILEEKGFRVGLYTSPHIIDFRERISQNGIFFNTEIYEKASEELMLAVNSAKDELPRPITWFELMTLYSFLCFKYAKIQYAVFEVGMGGRLDATNIIEPEICGITQIEKEHTEYLGTTIEKIAFEKAGIIKKGVPVIIGTQKNKNVYKVFEKKAKECNSLYTFIDNLTKIINFSYNFSSPAKETTFLTPTINIPTMDIFFESKMFTSPICAKLKMLGPHQAENAFLASVLCKTLFPNISKEHIEKGLCKATLPARFEITQTQNVTTIYDGAHTENSIKNTIATLKNVYPYQKYHALFACSEDKQIEKIAPLFKNTFQKITLTIPGYTKKTNLTKVKNAFAKENIPYTCFEDFDTAVKESLESAKNVSNILLVIGSFYLVSDMKKMMN